MPFTAHDLRYKAAETYPALYAHLSRHAQRFLGSLKFDAFELDVVVGHVVEQLVRVGLLGGGDETPLTALDQLTPAQFYAFLNRSIRNKAIDRLRKRRFQVSSAAEFESAEGTEGDDNPLNDVTESLWGSQPFADPQEITLSLASRQELRDLLKHCIQALSAAPRQLQAVLMELQEYDAVELLQDVVAELKASSSTSAFDTAIAHASQHRDHAHKKLRHCLQAKSTHLTVLVALRLTEYGVSSTHSKGFVVELQALAQDDLAEDDVRAGLNELVTEGLLDWDGGAVVHITPPQMKRLTRFYRDE
jgi:DNA-directed RNA polymerase specialized sigma24 family protein